MTGLDKAGAQPLVHLDARERCAAELVNIAALEAAPSAAFTLPDADDRKTQVWLTGFGDSALEFALVVWPSRDAVTPRRRHSARAHARVSTGQGGAGRRGITESSQQQFPLIGAGNLHKTLHSC
ncbi:MAG: hypothetical protein HC938_02575 [Nitrospira sp.]|nr:hypothetical protein [Nitrospira sp.]